MIKPHWRPFGVFFKITLKYLTGQLHYTNSMFGHGQDLSTKMETKGSLTDFECGMDSRIEHRVIKLGSPLTGFLCTQTASSRQTVHF